MVLAFFRNVVNIFSNIGGGVFVDIEFLCFSRIRIGFVQHSNFPGEKACVVTVSKNDYQEAAAEWKFDKEVSNS